MAIGAGMAPRSSVRASFALMVDVPPGVAAAGGVLLRPASRHSPQSRADVMFDVQEVGGKAIEPGGHCCGFRGGDGPQQSQS
ncbi:MAG: hypothetical protein WDN49_09345 [Acetobacteraceae bacterium]